MSNLMEKILREEKEAEEQMYGKQEETPSKEAPSPVIDEANVDAPTEESVDDVTSETQDEPKPKPKRENWKKRYIGYKSATDKTLNELRTSNSNLFSENDALRKQIAELFKEMSELKETFEAKKDPFEGVFSQEDIDLLGPEALAAMKKAALATKSKESKDDHEVKQLKAEIEAIRRKEMEREKEAAEAAKVNSLTDLRDRLSKVVPNFEQIDEDPKFGEFLADVDEYSDQIRMDLFTTAVNSRDVAGAARFYQEYAQTLESKSSFLDDHITPTGDAATEANPESRKKPTFHIKEYENFMDDVTRGKYRGKEKEARKLEMMYDKAFMENRIYE